MDLTVEDLAVEEAIAASEEAVNTVEEVVSRDREEVSIKHQLRSKVGLWHRRPSTL